MNQQLLVSIIIPTYDRENLLKDAISSVLNQAYKNFELIVVDDCSKDDTRKVVEGFQNVNIIYLRHHENKGVAAACNTGIQKASGDYVFILNDDDLIVPWAIEKLIEKIHQSKLGDLGGVYGWSWWVDNGGKTVRLIDSKEKGNMFEIILKQHIFTNLLIRKEVFKQVGLYDENLRNNEDFDFYLRMARKYQFDFVHEILTIVRKHNQGHLSSFSNSNMIGYQEIVKRYSNATPANKGFLASILSPKLYIGLSSVKNLIASDIKLVSNPELRKQMTAIRKIFGQKIKI